MTDYPSVSVVIPVLDGAGTIGQLLQALRHQTRPPAGVEVLVVDNGSTDGTQDIVRNSGVRLLEEPKRGPAAARNCGLRSARGEVIAHLDSDTLPTRNWLARLVAPFTDPATVLVAGRTLSYLPTTPAERCIASSGLFDAERAISRPVFPFAPSGNMAVRRASALAVGGWSEDLLTAEDVDFSFRLLRNRATEIVYQPEALLFHRNRRTPAQLKRQAWTYGQGAAQLYLRYPEHLRWDATKSAVLAGRLTARSLLPILFRTGRLLRLTTEDRVEFSRYHRLWTWNFWRGFLSSYHHRELRAR